MPNRKRKNSASRIEEVEWELRKRGIRPTGNLQSMVSKLDMAKQEEQRTHAQKSLAPSEVNYGPNCKKMKVCKKNEVAEERSQLVIWRKPIKTLSYFVKEIPCSLTEAIDRLKTSLIDPKEKCILTWGRLLILSFLLNVFLSVVYFGILEDYETYRQIKGEMYWYSYWIFLGILSSVGLGTGLHTFLLYLGPFIAKVTLASQECGSLQFPKPPYPDQLLCPDTKNPGGVLIWDIVSKIRIEALMWGLGTALGELPPYFLARAARVSGMNDDEHLEEFTQLLKRKNVVDTKSMGWLERGKMMMEDLIERVGFWGILICASIPNPLFDLAGITCGHFRVPFTTFFGATMIGKAIVKVHIQLLFVILAFDKELLNSTVNLIREIPKFGPLLCDPFVELINHQKAALHNQSEDSSEGSRLAYFLEKIVMVMVIYFVVSIINVMAQSYHKRVTKEKAKSKS